jgi:hypothetical protein
LTRYRRMAERKRYIFTLDLDRAHPVISYRTISPFLCFFDTEIVQVALPFTV